MLDGCGRVSEEGREVGREEKRKGGRLVYLTLGGYSLNPEWKMSKCFLDLV